MATKTSSKAAAETKAAALTKETKAEAPAKESKAAEPKKATTKKTAKAAAEKEEAAPVKTAEVKKEAVKKEEAPAAPNTAVIFEYGEKKVVAKELLAKAMESFQAAHADVVIQDVQLYVNADEGCAYIVVNGQEYPEDKISF